MQYFAERGATINIPLGHSPDYDFVADFDGRMLRVQVKTCRLQRDGRRYELRVATSGGNQSWNRIIKRLDPSRFDYLVAVVGDGRRWCIPADRVEGGCAILLGGPKYEEFEVEAGPAL